MVARKFKRDRRAINALKFTGQMDVCERNITVAIVFDPPYLTRLPKLYLLNRDRDLPEVTAHVEFQDRFCYAQNEEIQLDPLNPKGSVVLCLGLMRSALFSAIYADLHEDVTLEFPQHWLGTGVIFIDITPGFSGIAKLYSLPENREVITTSSETLRRLGVSTNRSLKPSPASPVHVISVPEMLTFANGQRTPSTLGSLLAWLRPISATAADALLASLAKGWPNLRFILSAPNGVVGGDLILPLILDKSIKRPRFFRKVLPMWVDKIQLNRFIGDRIDAEFILRRNMDQQPDLSGKRVAILGIGTIGGFVAKGLAQCGAGMKGGELGLFDEQRLSAGNLGRHALGLPYVGIGKARAMRDELSRSMPDCNIRIFEDDALKRSTDLLGFDLIIDATGDRAVSDVLNIEITSRRKSGDTVPPTVLYIWLVGNGAAAQALLVDTPEHACFRCLRLDQPDKERFPVLRDDHAAHLTPANCGEGAYFAYGIGAPMMAAGLAIQAVLDWVKGNPSPRFRTVRIDRDATNQTTDENLDRQANCPACAIA